MMFPAIKKFLTVMCGMGLALAAAPSALALDGTSYVTSIKQKGSFTLEAAGKAAPIFASGQDWPGVLRAARDLQADIHRVTQVMPAFSTSKAPAGPQVVIIGTIGKSPLIDALVKQKKLDVAAVAGKWEVFVEQLVDNPMPGVAQALVIAGSDKRGIIYGIYDLSQQIGVSPWYWWADVPTKTQKALYVSAGRHTQGEPKVKYRGIFLNDEAPALSGWAKEKFGGINSKMYVHVFELLLRLKGNPPLAENYGNWENTGLNAHIGGHCLSVLASMAAATSDARVQQRLTCMLDQLELCQQKNGDGYLGGALPSARSTALRASPAALVMLTLK